MQINPIKKIILGDCMIISIQLIFLKKIFFFPINQVFFATNWAQSSLFSLS
jgi:hypothetical protein